MRGDGAASSVGTGGQLRAEAVVMRPGPLLEDPPVTGDWASRPGLEDARTPYPGGSLLPSSIISSWADLARRISVTILHHIILSRPGLEDTRTPYLWFHP